MTGTPRSLDQETFTRLRRLYLIALGAIAISLIASQILIRQYLNDQENDSRLVNVAGRQRMLSQKLHKEVLLLASTSNPSGIEKLSDSIKHTLSRWENAHQLLQLGDESTDFDATNSPEIIEMFEKIDPDFQEVAEATKHFILLKSSTPEDSTALNNQLAIMGTKATSFLAKMDQIVNQYDMEAKEKVSSLQRLELLITLFTLLILVGEFLIIFWPSAKAMKQSIHELMEEVERLTKESFEEKIQQQKVVSRQIIENQENEQNRIAKDIHDGIGQMLTGLKYLLESVDASDPEKAAVKITKLKELTSNIIKGVRTATFNLTPPELKDYGIVPALTELTQELSKLTGKDIVLFNKSDFNQRMDSLIEINLYRITQEAINNAIKYAESSHIIVTISHSQTILSIIVDDNGKGFDKSKLKAKPDKEGGMGLTFMKERVKYINGRYPPE